MEAETAGAGFSSIRLESPWKTPRHFVEQAESAVFDLLTHFWSGGLEQGCILPTMHGYSAPNLTDPRGGLWERAMMAFSLDTLHRATGDPTLSLRLKAEWARLNRLYTPEELEAAGGPLHPACDDTSWDALYYLTLSRHSGDQTALDRAQGLVNNSFRRWLDDELGGGMWDSNERTSQGYYGGSWGGPAESPGSIWCRKGSRPKQIMTSASSVNMIAAAALSD